ncbi:DNA alkylation repair protein [Capnocytophaga gingivalis]|uniref:DNA alkylation repair protein n=1 Tax=Capnocytophaga gingivalis TaxID=1017 RepID=UPI0028EAF118|nr:DNA alkylation repair protein [Capnocytophaga gingivalis]
MSQASPFVPLLLTLQDIPYGDFTHKLIPTLSRECIIGVRLPALRKAAKDLTKQQPEAVALFLNSLPHYYHEENLLHGFLIEQVKAFDKAIAYTEAFLPYIDNWAVCDTFSPKLFQKHPRETYAHILQWLKSPQPYTIRYGIGLLLSNYLDDYFEIEMLYLVASIQSDEYYVNMMIAWYFATALAKQYEATLPLIQSQTLSPFVQNKTIQKARESRRITQEVKEMLVRWRV